MLAIHVWELFNYTQIYVTVQQLFLVKVLLLVKRHLRWWDLFEDLFFLVNVSAPRPTIPAPPSTVPGCNQILCCAFNADGSIFVTGSSDKIARVCLLYSNFENIIIELSDCNVLHISVIVHSSVPVLSRS